jgi:hypothetical protein
MKTVLLAKAGAIIIACSILAIFLVSTSLANRHDNGQVELSSESSCSDNAGIFPASVYTRLFTGKNGFVSGFEIHLSSEDGNCSSMLYSSNAAEGGISFRTHNDENEMAVALR